MDEKIQNNQELSTLASLVAVVLCIFFGANAVAIKVTLAGMGVFSSAGIRFFIASIVIIIWAKLTKRDFNIKSGQFKQLCILTAMFVVQLTLYYWGISKTEASRAILLVNLQPFLILILAHFFIPGDNITIKKIVSMIFGFSGVLIIVLSKSRLGSFQSEDVVILIVAFIWACNGVYVKKINSEYISFHLVLYPMLFSGPFFLMAGYFFDPKVFFLINHKVVLGLMYQSFVTASFGFIIWNYLLKKYKTSSLHSFVFIMTVSGVLFGNFILNEELTLYTILSLLLISTGIIIQQHKFRIIDRLFKGNL